MEFGAGLTHRATALTRYTHNGIGYASDPNSYFTQDLGKY